jgi:hypothetical protein
MPNETVVKNSIKIFSSKYMADLAYDLDSSYVLDFNFVTTFKNKLKRVFEKEEPVLLEEPVEEISGFFSIIPKGLKSVLSCLSRTDEVSFLAGSQKDLSEFHIVVNCYDPASNDNYIGYYLEFCRINEAISTDLSNITKPIEIRFVSGAVKTVLGAFDAFNAAGTNSANQEVLFNYTPVLFEGNYAVKVFKDDTILVKGTDYSEDATKVTVFSPVPTSSKITLVYIYSP